MNRTALPALAAVLVLAACGSSNSASESHFKKSINRYAEQNGVCLPLALDVQTAQGLEARSHTMLGEPLIRIAEQDLNGGNINQTAIKQMRLLDSEGFYKRQKTEDSNGIRTQIYQRTDKGEAQTQASPHGSLFCIGIQTVEKINWYTEPAAANGVTITKVSYQAKLKTESWANKLLKQGGDEWQHISDSRSQTATLMQTNDGWRDIRELR